MAGSTITNALKTNNNDELIAPIMIDQLITIMNK